MFGSIRPFALRIWIDGIPIRGEFRCGFGELLQSLAELARGGKPAGWPVTFNWDHWQLLPDKTPLEACPARKASEWMEAEETWISPPDETCGYVINTAWI